MKVLVTGGMGYIGSHVVDLLAEHGHEIHVVDSTHTFENYDFVKERATNLYNTHVQKVATTLSGTHFDAIVGLAAYISVEESTKKPHNYWYNNLTSLMELDHLTTDHLIFASTGTAFNPTNPYSRTKVACEQYIQDVLATDTRWFDTQTTFRFYNVSGLKNGIKATGQPTHLIRLAALVAKGLRDELVIYGNDYPTKDGTAVRDYIHVEDIAASIVNAVELGSTRTKPFECLGTGVGSSVLDVVQSMQKVAGKAICVRMASRRQGDDAITMCPDQYENIVITKTLEDMCLSALENV